MIAVHVCAGDVRARRRGRAARVPAPARAHHAARQARPAHARRTGTTLYLTFPAIANFVERDRGNLFRVTLFLKTIKITNLPLLLLTSTTPVDRKKQTLKKSGK